MPELSIYPDTPGPTNGADNGGSTQRALGMAFKSSIDTFAIGCRWFAPTTRPSGGDPTMSLWSVAASNSNTGTLLASVSIAELSLSLGGWNRFMFSSAIALTANAWYVTQIWSPNWYVFSGIGNFPRSNGTLSSAAGDNSGGNGRFSNGATALSLAQVQVGSTGFDFWADIITDVNGLGTNKGGQFFPWFR